jgi:hypothetical protein
MLMLPKPEEYRRKAEELETQAKRTRDLKAEEDFRPHVAQARGASRTKVTVRRAFRAAPAKPLLAVPISPIARGTLVLEQ